VILLPPLLLLLLAPAKARAAGCNFNAISPNCMCCKRDTSSVPIYINYDSFGAYGPKTYTCNTISRTHNFPGNSVRAQVEFAMTSWNNAGANVMFYYAGEAPANVQGGCDLSPPNCNAVVIAMVNGCGPVGFAGWCDSGVWLYGYNSWDTNWNPSGAIFMAEILTHELGHSLGFLDNYACGSPGHCTSPGVCIGESVMAQAGDPPNGYGITNPHQMLFLWNRDIAALRHDPLYGYGERTATRVKAKYSTNGFSTSYTLNDPLISSNVRPAQTFGGGWYHRAVAVSGSNTFGDNDIYVARGDGVAWSPSEYVGAYTQAGLTMGYGGGLLLLLYQSASNTRNIVWLANATGNPGAPAWTWPAGFPYPTNGPPALDFNSYRQYFVLVWPGRTMDSYLCATTSAVCGSGPARYLCGWRTPVSCLSANHVLRATRGPAVSCDPASSDCLVSWGSPGYADHQVLTIPLRVNANGSVSWLTQSLNAVASLSTPRSLYAASAPSGTWRYLLTARPTSSSFNTQRRDSTLWGTYPYNYAAPKRSSGPQRALWLTGLPGPSMH
jgi:hypothetical protein